MLKDNLIGLKLTGHFEDLRRYFVLNSFLRSMGVSEERREEITKIVLFGEQTDDGNENT